MGITEMQGTDQFLFVCSLLLLLILDKAERVAVNVMANKIR